MIPEREGIEDIAAALANRFGVSRRERSMPVLDTLIAGILSQNTNDQNRDRAYASLKERFPTWEDVLNAKPRDIARAIRVGGLAAQRSIRIKDVLRWVKDTRGELDLDSICRMGSEEAADLLLTLKGVGIKTARVVLLFACGADVFPVDTHILRVSKRLELLPGNCSPEKAHRIMDELIPPGQAYPLHLNLIRLGRTICKPKNPRCEECPIAEYCRFKQMGHT